MAADICVPVNSRWVLYIALISDKLVVQFKNGDCALYPGSNEALFNRMRLAPSKGRFVNRFLRHLPYRKIAPPCPLADLTVNVGGCDVPRTLTVSQVECIASTTITYNASTERWEGTLVQSSGSTTLSMGYYTAPFPLSFFGDQWYLNLGGTCTSASNVQLLGGCDPFDMLSTSYPSTCCGIPQNPSVHITE